MKDFAIHIPVRSFAWEELSDADRILTDRAKEAALCSYSPYSHFAVGAAVALANGEIVTGSNQENAAYPSGTCAERCVMFYAGARYPDVPPVTLAIAARGTDGEFTIAPITPCGACRQVLAEVQTRYGTALRLLLYGQGAVYEVMATDLLPLRFDADALVPTK